MTIRYSHGSNEPHTTGIPPNMQINPPLPHFFSKITHYFQHIVYERVTPFEALYTTSSLLSAVRTMKITPALHQLHSLPSPLHLKLRSARRACYKVISKSDIIDLNSIMLCLEGAFLITNDISKAPFFFLLGLPVVGTSYKMQTVSPVFFFLCNKIAMHAGSMFGIHGNLTVRMRN
jgi:hypothetical protein